MVLASGLLERNNPARLALAWGDAPAEPIGHRPTISGGSTNAETVKK
jgi:hypothetical protein